MKTRTFILTLLPAVFAFQFLNPCLAQPGRKGPNMDRPGHFMLQQLNATQQQEIKQLIQSLRDQNATQEEIKTAVDAKLNEWGIERPAKGQGDEFSGLSEEQREQLKTTVENLCDQGADRKEIRAAVKALYAEWGLEMPKHFPGRFGKARRLWADENLTEEQRAEIKSQVQELRDQGADREEIHKAVLTLLEKWGIEPPDFEFKHPGQGGTWKDNLTDEQKQALKELTRQMREQGATKEEIRLKVREQLREWGIHKPAPNEKNKKLGKGKIEAQNSPNPFNPSTTITYTLQQPEFVSIELFNAQGKVVRILTQAGVEAGTHSILWDALDDKGERVSTGLYFYKITAGSETFTGQMTLVK